LRFETECAGSIKSVARRYRPDCTAAEPHLCFAMISSPRRVVMSFFRCRRVLFDSGRLTNSKRHLVATDLTYGS